MSGLAASTPALARWQRWKEREKMASSLSDYETNVSKSQPFLHQLGATQPLRPYASTQVAAQQPPVNVSSTLQPPIEPQNEGVSALDCILTV